MRSADLNVKMKARCFECLRVNLNLRKLPSNTLKMKLKTPLSCIVELLKHRALTFDTKWIKLTLILRNVCDQPRLNSMVPAHLVIRPISMNRTIKILNIKLETYLRNKRYNSGWEEVFQLTSLSRLVLFEKNFKSWSALSSEKSNWHSVVRTKIPRKVCYHNEKKGQR